MQKTMQLTKKILRYFFLPLLVLMLAWIGYFKIYGNFHQVDTNLYRSAQLYNFNLPHYIQKYNIKSVINLRGSSKDAQWYQDEIHIAKKYDITHYDFGLPDRRVIPLEKMDTLVALMRQAPKPLLIHCKAGADRTSLASALYLYAIQKDRNAQNAISITYGHFPWLGSKTKAMDISFQNYQNNRIVQ